MANEREIWIPRISKLRELRHKAVLWGHDVENAKFIEKDRGVLEMVCKSCGKKMCVKFARNTTTKLQLVLVSDGAIVDQKKGVAPSQEICSFPCEYPVGKIVPN